MEEAMSVSATSSADGYPSYAELLARTDAPAGSSWGVFGPDDECGSVNFMTDETVKEAFATVRRGRRFNLDYALDAFPDNPFRVALEHKLVEYEEFDVVDDYLDGFYPQCTSQIDGLRHSRHTTHGYYNGADPAAIRAGSPTLGVGRWAAGIIGRGVLLDVGRHLERAGTPIDLEADAGMPLSAELLEAVAQAQGISFRPGDILMIRTGWAGHVLSDAGAGFRERDWWRHAPGLEQSRDMLAFLWDNRFAAIGADNPGLEASPPVPDSPFTEGTQVGKMHQDMIAMLGLSIGELWALEELAADCAQDGTYDCAVVLKPLFLTGGAGTPTNGVAIR